MNRQIMIRNNPELLTMYGMTDEEKKKVTIAVIGGIVTGIAVLFLVKYYKKKRR